eukprot:COSAG02_NODE_51734_length_312_cov_0.732394_1_plen_30_part_10
MYTDYQRCDTEEGGRVPTTVYTDYQQCTAA